MTGADTRAGCHTAAAKAADLNGGQGAVAFRSDFQPLQTAGAIADRNMFLATIQNQSHRCVGFARQMNRERAVVADAVLGAEATAREIADDANLLWLQTKNFDGFVTNTQHVLRGCVQRQSVVAPIRTKPCVSIG